MPKETVCGATCRCTFGSAPSKLIVLPNHRTFACGMPAGNITDHKSLINIQPFGLCRSLANPTVAAATAANGGVLKPMPCIPSTPVPWVPGAPNILIDKSPALKDTSKLMCTYAGVISIVDPGQPKVFLMG